jgi:hypothetical protein
MVTVELLVRLVAKPGPVPAQPAPADHDAVCGHRPHHRNGRPDPPGRLDTGQWGIETFHHIRNTTVAEDASQIPPTPLGFEDRSGIRPDAAIDA